MAEITLLDGGMGQELLRRSGNRPTPLWSTQVMADHPGLVAEVHADYRTAGALTAGKPVWVALTVDDNNGRFLRSGEPLSDALPYLDAAYAVLANCAAPEAIADAVPVLADAGKPFGAYANAFTQISGEFLKDKPTVDALQTRRDLDPDADADARFAMRWIDQGATIVGGCCEVGPAHIAVLAKAISAAGHRIV